MGSAGYEILIIFLLILANGIFAMSEIALITSRKMRLHQRAEAGDKRAKAALDLANAPGRFLSTVQIGITCIGIFAGAYGGATLAEKLSAALTWLPLTPPYRDVTAIAIVVIVITYLSLVIGELVPKRFALTNPERIAVIVARPMRLLARAAGPLVHLLTKSTDGLLRLMGIRPSADPPVTEEEIRILIEQGTLAGVFHPAEQELVGRVFQLADRHVGQLMTPRPDIVWLNVNEPMERTVERIMKSGHSRYPVGEHTLDNVIGVVRAKDLLGWRLTHQTFNLRAVMREPLFVPEAMPAIKLLDTFRQSARHIGVVIDEHGSIQGVVTHHDILEAVVGEIATLTHPDDQPVVKRDDGSWLIDGMFPVEDLKRVANVDELPGEGERNFVTLGGFVLYQLGRIPAVGDHFESAGLHFEVVDMDGRRVDRVLVTPRPEPPDR